MGRKKIKLFNKTLEEFILEFNKLTKSTAIYELLEQKDIDEYKENIKNISDFFTKKEKESLKSVVLLVNLKIYSMDDTIYNSNSEIIWNYLQNLYYISLSKNELITININQAKSVSAHETKIVSAHDGMDSIIKDISKTVMEKLKDTDVSQINPQTLFNELMSGSRNINGIDFTSIIESAAQNIQNKAQNGEIDLEKLKELSNTMLPNSFK